MWNPRRAAYDARLRPAEARRQIAEAIEAAQAATASFGRRSPS